MLASAIAYVLLGPGYEQYLAWRAEAAYRRGDGDAKRQALRELGGLPTGRSRRVIREALVDPIPMARAAAAGVIYSGKYEDLVDDLWTAIQREPDRRVRASMIVDWSQSVGSASETRLRQFAGSADAYERFGATRGLLRLAETSVAEDMFAYAADADRFRRRDAQRDLLSLCRQMAEMIGQPPPSPAGKIGKWPLQDLEQLHGWWREHVTPRLLKDCMSWRVRKPENWQKVTRLLREWEKRTPSFLPTGEDEQEDG